jgi:hypothetical protein
LDSLYKDRRGDDGRGDLSALAVGVH